MWKSISRRNRSARHRGNRPPRLRSSAATVTAGWQGLATRTTSDLCARFGGAARLAQAGLVAARRTEKELAFIRSMPAR